VEDDPRRAPVATKELAALRAIAEGTAPKIGSDFFESLVEHLARAAGVDCAFVAYLAESSTRAHTLALWDRGRLLSSIEVDPDVGDDPGRCPVGLAERLPSQARLEGYLGVPLLDGAGERLGHLAVADRRPLPAEPRRLFIVRIFAARAAAELERLRAEKLVRQAQQDRARLQQQNLYLQEEIKARHNGDEIIGRSPALLSVLDAVHHVAGTDSTVLIQGETGTGKELIARALHSSSRRKDRPLIKLSCALPAGQLESELFGQEKGALARRVGRFELAHGGTLFLDEVGEVPAEAQPRLLRVLEQREFERVGGSAPLRVDVRVLAASNRDLPARVRARSFREDLYQRLSVFSVRVPPLRERQEDIPLLVHFLVGKFAAHLAKRIERVSHETMCRLSAYAWPGNVRELENVLERAVLLAPGPVLEIGPDVLPVHPTPCPATLEAAERQHILGVLGQTAWTIEGPSGAARILGLHPNTLRSRLKKLGIHRPGHEPS
jgi:transcriptional regulator with GAF, ATPase, and Fis domain